MESEVIIIGLGPVGAMAANLLGQYGITTRVFEKLTDIYFAPRAMAIDAEALRTFGMVGLADWMDQHICKSGAELRTAAPPHGEVLMDLSDLAKRQRYGCHQFGTFHQPTVEKKLRDRLEEFPNVQLCLGHEVTEFVESNGKVWVTVRAISGHHTEEYQCKYLLACDGGRSFARKRLGFKYKGFSLPEHWLVMDVNCDDDSIDEQWPRTTIVTGAERAFLYAKLPGNMRRIEVLLKPDEKALAVVREDNTAALLSQIGIDVHQLTFERRMVYKFHARAVSEWHKGRTILMGDAAHCMPPTKGQGMCCGLEDAANLCWKVAMLCRGNLTNQLHIVPDKDKSSSSSEAAQSTISLPIDRGDKSNQLVNSILQSYQMEREPWVTKQTEMIIGLRRLVTLKSPVLMWLRNLVFRFMNNIYGAEYLRADQYKGLMDLHSGFIMHQSPGAGQLFIQPAVTHYRSKKDISNVLLDEVMGWMWCWLTLDVEPVTTLPKQHHAFLSSIGCTFVRVLRSGSSGTEVAQGDGQKEVLIVDDGGHIERWMRQHDCQSVLVRPDRFVFGTMSDKQGAQQGSGSVIDQLQSMLTGDKPLVVAAPSHSSLPVIIVLGLVILFFCLLFLLN